MSSKPQRLKLPVLPFANQMNRAVKELDFNCGPTAIAAIMCLDPFYLPAHLPDFAKRLYTSPKMMKDCLKSLGVTWHLREGEVTPQTLTKYGLCRIQFEGPWYGKFAYHYTHWCAAAEFANGLWVWDVNQAGNGWQTFTHWCNVTMPKLISYYKRATGGWNCTHRLELDL
jgi:hypothetical protein